MAKRGRKPTPTARKKLDGNPGKRPLNENEWMPDAGMPSPPEHLDSYARAEWDRLGPELNRAGLLTSADRAAFAAYCVAYGLWVLAELERQKLPGAGLVHVTDNGNRVQEPLLGIANKAWDRVLKAAAEFGLTPSSRSRVSVPNVEKDSFEEFLAETAAAGAPVN